MSTVHPDDDGNVVFHRYRRKMIDTHHAMLAEFERHGAELLQTLFAPFFEADPALLGIRVWVCKQADHAYDDTTCCPLTSVSYPSLFYAGMPRYPTWDETRNALGQLRRWPQYEATVAAIHEAMKGDEGPLHLREAPILMALLMQFGDDVQLTFTRTDVSIEGCTHSDFRAQLALRSTEFIK